MLVALSRTTRPLTGSEIAKLVRRGTRPGVQRALHRLVAHGLVNSQEAGRAILYVLNRDHLAFPAVESLAEMRSEFLRRMREAIAGWDVQPVHVALFGSAARGDGDVEADIDVLIVRPAEIEDIYGNPEKAKKELGWQYDMSIENIIEVLLKEEVDNFNKK